MKLIRQLKGNVLVDNIKLWSLDNESTAKAVIEQADYEPITNSFGANDFVVEFLKKWGLWDMLVNAEAKLLKMPNGIDPRRLNEVMAVKELVGIKRISNSKPILDDVCLMTELGFNLEEVIAKRADEKGVISSVTLRNHCDRIPTEESYRAFYEQVSHQKQKRWFRGGLYAVDGYEIEITVNSEKTDYEDAGKVWSDKEKRWKYGYKLLLLVNISKDRERIVGAYLDRIETNELKIFEKMIAHIEHYVCPLEELIKELVADRAYWDEKLIRLLKLDKGIDCTLLAKKNLTFVKHDLKDLLKQKRIEFKPYQIKNRKYYKRKTKKKLSKPSKEPEYIDVELAVERNMDFGVFKDGFLNIVIRRDEQPDSSYHYMFYMTTKSIKSPVTVVDKYRDRTAIENDVNRELDQRWFIRSLAGRSRNIMLARIMLVLKLFNCEKILEMKHPKYWQDVKKRMNEKEDHSFLQEVDVAVYITGSDIFGIFKASEFALLIKERTKFALKEKVCSIDKPLTREDLLAMIDTL